MGVYLYIFCYHIKTFVIKIVYTIKILVGFCVFLALKYCFKNLAEIKMAVAEVALAETKKPHDKKKESFSMLPYLKNPRGSTGK